MLHHTRDAIMKAVAGPREWAGGYAKRENKVAAILTRRLSTNRARDLTGLLYLNEHYTLGKRWMVYSRLLMKYLTGG